MPLPILEAPTYELNLPSTGKKVKYRPFLVKEYKILLTALEADNKEISRVVTELIDVCTFNKLDVNKLSHFDIEYLFLNIRSKSISEIAEVVITCDCGEQIDVAMDLTKAEVKTEGKLDNKVMITEDLGVVMRYPKFEEIIEIQENTKNENIINLICNCVDAVFTKEEYYDKTSYTNEELEDFINSFSKDQFGKLEDFFRKIPKIQQTLEADCPKCGKHNTATIEGLQYFFV